MRRVLAIFSVIVLLCAAALLAVLRLPAYPSGEVFVEIPPGMGSRQIAVLLAERKVIRNQYLFAFWRMIEGGPLQAGEYRFAGPQKLADVYGRLERGDVYAHTVTVPEGYNLFDIAQALQDAGLGSKQVFVEAARRDVGLIADLDPQAGTLEGYLFPDTYRFQKFQTPAQMLGAMVKRFRVAAAVVGLAGNYHRTVVLASLIEKETPQASDRAAIASVFENRLAMGMPLMTDPTVIYAAMLENRYRGTIYRSDLQAQSAYNTYLHAGLPPGPICNPGIAALEAALHPAKTNYLYFVADPADPGASRFAATLAEHERNVKAYRDALKAKAAH